jgi:hypothetical protein
MRNPAQLPFPQLPELKPGMAYRVGAIGNQGKTFFMTKLAQHCAEQGANVFYAGLLDQSVWTYDLLGKSREEMSGTLTVQVLPAGLRLPRALNQMLDQAAESDLAIIDDLDVLCTMVKRFENGVHLAYFETTRRALEAVSRRNGNCVVTSHHISRTLDEKRQDVEPDLTKLGSFGWGSIRVYPYVTGTCDEAQTLRLYRKYVTPGNRPLLTP